MSFFRTTIGVACCPVWKGLSLLYDFIYVSCLLDGCSFSWILRSANMAIDYLANLNKTRIGPLGWVVNPPPSSVDILSSVVVYARERLVIFALFSFLLCVGFALLLNELCIKPKKCKSKNKTDKNVKY